ncbi:S8 family serine peptidase [Methanosarcina sp. T3]|uniref:S8 family serine peptidase n=1 Tax=Methanosarcina sp. T3 TaxID=3439062 RepID=UPI003F826EB3
MPLLMLCGLLIGSIIPVYALDTADSGSYDIFEKLTVDVPGDQKYVPGEILVKFDPGASEEKIKSINAGHGTQVTYTSPYAGFKILKIPTTKTVEEMVEIFSKNPNVGYAVPNAIIYAFAVPDDPYYNPYQWNFKNGVGGINLEPAWDISTGQGVVVAVLDTGVAYENYGSYIVAPDLANTYFVSGYDFVNNDAHPNDDNGHGTHVTGTIAQSTNNGIGAAGVAYDCSIMPVKVLNSDGSGTLAQIADGIYYATEHDADIISMSLGYQTPKVDPVLKAALDNAYNSGVTIVAAAGNDMRNKVSYPAAYEKCIAVGATRYDGSRAYYSNYGSALDVVAPGGDIRVDQNGDGYGDGILQNTFNTTTKDPTDFGYQFFQGTSMATPHVSGIAALLIAKGANGPEEVRAVIQNTATDLGTSGWDPEYGYGLVNATAALDSIQNQQTVNNPPVAEAGGPYTGGTGTALAFDGSASSDSDGSIVSYEWDFGDGNTSSDMNPENTYSTAGTYTVTLTVTDNENAVGTDTATVEVTEASSENKIHISDVSVETSSRTAGKNIFVSARAVVTILDSSDNPVEGATVSGYWSGASSDLDSAVTNAAGKVMVYSDEVKYKSGTLTFTFTVNGLSHTIPWDKTVTSGEGTYP